MGKLSTERAKEIGSKGGKAKAKNQKKQKKEYEDMSFEEIVNKYTSGNDLKQLYDGLMRSGKKGSVKATETILKYLKKKENEEKENEFAL